MSHFTDLRVFQEARQNIRSIARLCEQTPGFGDIANQVKRAAISVASNIAEGAGSSSCRQNTRFLSVARASNHELLAQVMIISDLNPNTNNDDLIENIQYVGKMLTKMIQYLKNTET